MQAKQEFHQLNYLFEILQNDIFNLKYLLLLLLLLMLFIALCGFVCVHVHV